MKKYLLLILLLVMFGLFLMEPNKVSASGWWKFQSIDTMKYSRDTAREKLTDPSFDTVIDQQVSQIASTGATHVAIATPYDEEFVPFLTRWVKAAHKYNLHVWFRGNMSGWEGWFDYPKITRAQHLQQTLAFIQKHADLFSDGDVFSACPECENGGPGDPRLNGDVDGHRQFLIDEYQQISKVFRDQGKDITTNYNSMNADVARLIMDQDTTQQLGGVVVIDHYVATGKQLASDVEDIAHQSGGKVVLGEYGAPIPGIHPDMTEKAQAAWIDDSLNLLTADPDLVGVNYWVSVGGSTQLWNENGSTRLAVQSVKKYFNPPARNIIVHNVFGAGLKTAKIDYMSHTFTPDAGGVIALPISKLQALITVSAPGYFTQKAIMPDNNLDLNITLIKINPNIFEKLFDLIYRLFKAYNIG